MKSNELLKQSVLFAFSLIVIFLLTACPQPEKYDRPPVITTWYISYTRVVTDGTDIFLYGTASDDGKNLTHLGSGKNEQSAISPDNTRIAFETYCRRPY